MFGGSSGEMHLGPFKYQSDTGHESYVHWSAVGEVYHEPIVIN